MEELNLTMEQRKILLDAAKTCERSLHLRVARIFQQGKPIDERTLTDWNKDVDLIIKTLEFLKNGLNDLVKMQILKGNIWKKRSFRFFFTFEGVKKDIIVDNGWYDEKGFYNTYFDVYSAYYPIDCCPICSKRYEYVERYDESLKLV